MKNIPFIIFFVLATLVAVSQDDLTQKNFVPQFKHGFIYQIKTKIGTGYSGFVVDETKEFVNLENRKSHEIYEIRKSEIVLSRIYTDKRAQSYLMDENAHAGNYMLSSSALLFDKPNVTVNYEWFLFDNTSFSLNKNWDVNVNSILLFPYSVGVKCAYEIAPETYLGGNIFAIGNVTGQKISNFILGYGAIARITKGNTNNNFTVSGGILGVNNELLNSRSKVPFINLPFGGFAYFNRFSERWGVNLETFYFPVAQVGFLGGGFKFIRDKFTSWSFGCFGYMNLANNQFSFGKKALPIPFISYSMNIFAR